MGFLGELVPAENPHADEDRFQEKSGRGLDGQQGSEDIAHVSRVLRPVGPELEFKGNTGHHAHGEVDQKELAPEFGHAQIGFISGLDIPAFHVGHQDREAQGKRYEEEVKHGR